MPPASADTPKRVVPADSESARALIPAIASSSVESTSGAVVLQASLSDRVSSAAAVTAQTAASPAGPPLEEEVIATEATEQASGPLLVDTGQRIFDAVVRLNFLNRVCFGKSLWAQYFGDIGEEPALPSAIHSILTGPCPFWEGRKVYETHLLVLIPASVNGAPFSLALLGELIKTPRGGGHRTAYRDYDSNVAGQFGAVSPASSYWVLLTRDVLVGSRDESYADQQALVAEYADYTLPSTLEAATAILLHHVRTGERLYSDADPWTYTRCRDQVELARNYPVVVGGFSSEGLWVNLYGDYSLDSSSNGVSSCRKF